MDLAVRIVMLSFLLLSVSRVDAGIVCSIISSWESSSDSILLCCAQEFEVNISCVVNTTVLAETIICDDSTSDDGSTTEPSDTINNDNKSCMEIESALLNATGIEYIFNSYCNCTTCWAPVINSTCSNAYTDTEDDMTSTTTPDLATTTSTPTITNGSATTPQPMTETSTMMTSHSQSTYTTSETTVPVPLTSGSLRTTRVSLGFTSTAAAPSNSSASLVITTMTVLWIVLGCLIALIVITLGAIFLVSVAHCRRYKRKLLACMPFHSLLIMPPQERRSPLHWT